jgi:hypothetical protein
MFLLEEVTVRALVGKLSLPVFRFSNDFWLDDWELASFSQEYSGSFYISVSLAALS